MTEGQVRVTQTVVMTSYLCVRYVRVLGNVRFSFLEECRISQIILLDAGASGDGPLNGTCVSGMVLPCFFPHKSHLS
jgi:hypothetical protein